MLYIYKHKQTGETKRVMDEEKKNFYDESDKWELKYQVEDTQFTKTTKK